MTVMQIRRMAALAVTGLCVLVSASSASAATVATPFGCRASAERSTVGPIRTEPVVANDPLSPCVTASAGLSTASVPASNGSVAGSGPAGAFTYSSTSAPTTAGPLTPSASAIASVDGVTAPTSGGTISSGPVETHVSEQCVNGKVVSAATSTLDTFEINGQTQTLTPGQSQTYQLGGGSYVTVNEKLQTSNSLTERAMDIHLQGLGDIVEAESEVTQTSADPCAGTAVGATPGSVDACPTGSTYVAAVQLCEIVLPGGGVIVISSPFQGPTGGSVMPLSTAKKLYRSECLEGPGPNYVIVGTNGPDRINGTRRGERILGLGGNDRIAGQGGNDCIDGGAGNDRIWGGNGNDRVFGGPGNDRISVQNGNAYVDGGSGNDQIFLGNGNDTVYGGPGNDRIAVGRGNNHVYGGPGNKQIATGDGNNYVYAGPGNDMIWVGNGTDHVFGGRGHDRIYAPGEKDYVYCGSGHDVVFVNVFAAPFANAHGCDPVHVIHPHTI